MIRSPQMSMFSVVVSLTQIFRRGTGEARDILAIRNGSDTGEAADLSTSPNEILSTLAVRSQRLNAGSIWKGTQASSQRQEHAFRYFPLLKSWQRVKEKGYSEISEARIEEGFKAGGFFGSCSLSRPRAPGQAVFLVISGQLTR